MVAEPLEAADEVVQFEEVEAPTPFSVRLDAWRRHYLPLPDEVVHEYLGEDEYVVHSDHPSFRAFLMKNAFQVLGVGVVGLLFLIFVRGGFDLWTLLIFLLLQLFLAVLAIQRLNDRYTSYVITNLRLIRVSGVFGRRLASIPWTRMTGLGYRQKPLGRILGYATIFIESANEESGLREFSDINDPARFHQKILDMVSSKSGQSNREPPPATRGERKSFLQRRRERRAVSFERARRAAGQAIGRKRSTEEEVAPEPAPTPVPDTAGVYEALSTTDAEPSVPGAARSPAGSSTGAAGSGGSPVAGGGSAVEGRRRERPAQPSSGAGRSAGGSTRAEGRASPSRQGRPAGPDTPGAGAAAEAGGPSVEDGSDTTGRRGPNWLWPGGGEPAKPPRAAKARQARPTRPVGRTGPTGPAGSAGHAGPATPAGRPGPAGPAGRTGPAGPARSTGPAGSTGSPKITPPSQPPPRVPVDEDADQDEARETPGRRRPRAGWIWSRREPPLGRPTATPPPRRRGADRGEPASPEDGTSARDALASIRRGQRPARPIRRPRLPSFGRRSRPTFPESRQLPAAREDRPEDEDATAPPPTAQPPDDSSSAAEPPEDSPTEPDDET